MTILFDNVTYKIPHGEIIYQNLSLELSEFKYYGVLGKNGAGKSTLIEIMMGMRKLQEGKVTLWGEDVYQSKRATKNKIFTVTHDMQIPGMIVLKDLLNYYKHFYTGYSEGIEAQLLSMFEIDKNKKFGSFSTGQKIKGLLVAAFAARADLYLFDEVTAVLDPKSRHLFLKFLDEYKVYHNCTIFLATNLIEDLTHTVDKVIYIDDHHKVDLKESIDLKTLFFEDGEDIAA